MVPMLQHVICSFYAALWLQVFCGSGLAAMLLASAVALGARNRALQDYLAWPSFGTSRLWRDVQANPSLAGELIAQHLALLGLSSPTEPTSAAVAAAIVVGIYGPAAASVIAEAEIVKWFMWFKAVRCV